MTYAMRQRLRAIVRRQNRGAIYGPLRPMGFRTADGVITSIGDGVYFAFGGVDHRSGRQRIAEGLVIGVRYKRNNLAGQKLVEVVRPPAGRRSERPASAFYADRAELMRALGKRGDLRPTR